jgi:O-antigen ligase
VAFYVFSTVSYFWSVAPDLTVSRIMTMTVLLVTTATLLRHLPHLVGAVPVAYLIGAVAASVFVLAAPTSIDMRRTAHGNANDVALTLVFGLGCALFLLLFRRGKPRILGILSVFPLTAAAITTGSRTAVVALLVMLVLVFAFLVKERKGQQVVLLLLVIAAGAALVGSLPADMIPERLLELQQQRETVDLSNREYIWEAIRARGFDLLGVGAGATSAYLGWAIGYAKVAHNVFLGVLLEAGILGALLFFSGVAVAIWRARASVYRHLLIFILPALIAGSLTLSLEARRIFWFGIALSLAAAPGLRLDKEGT